MRDFPKWIEDTLPTFMPGTTRHTQNWLRGLALRASAKALLGTNRALTTEDFRKELTKITVPTLLIHGDEDATCPIDITARRTTELTPGAKLKVYEGAPLGLFVTHIERLNADLSDFVHGQRSPVG